MFNKIKKGIKRALSSKPITYRKKSSPTVRKQKKTPPKGIIRQYGDKGYKPSNGRGVGY